MLWSGSAWWSAGAVTFLFPLIFMLDDWVAAPLSPVLPLVVVLALVWIVAPFVLTELMHRRWRTLDGAARSAKTNKWRIGGRRMMLSGTVFFAGWLIFGA